MPPADCGGCGQGVEGAHARRVLGVLGVRAVLADRADAHGLAVHDGDLAGGAHDATVDDGGHVGCDGRGDGGQFEAELGELLGGEHEGSFRCH